jgi:hypothetical protein
VHAQHIYAQPAPLPGPRPTAADRAHAGLARSHHAASDPARALDHWHKALALYDDLGTPEADQIRASLATDRSEVIQAVSLSADPSPRRTRLVIRGNPVRDPDHSRWPAGVTERPDLRP